MAETCVPRWLVVCLALALVLPLAGASAGHAQTRSLELEIHEVTRPDVAVSPDGAWLVFTALGHLFRLPATGGEAEQLTFGPFFDSDPAISPDGRRVVFASDRDGESNGNLFLLDLASGDVRQLTRERWAARPVWSPDGRSIGYLSYEPQAMWAEYEFVAPEGVLTHVRRIGVDGGAPETLTEAAGLVRCAFFRGDGRLAWTLLDGEPERTRLMVESPRGATELASVAGVLDRVVADGSGSLYARRYGIAAAGFLVPQAEEIVRVAPGGAESMIVDQLESPQPRPAFGLAVGSLFFGDRGKLWRIDAASGERRPVDFVATVTMEVWPRSEPAAWAPGAARSVGVLDPRLSPDGESLVFTAAGFLWRQRAGGGPARRLFEGDGFEWSAAISADGRRIAYQHSEGNVQELRLADLESGAGRTLVTVDRTGRFEPAWSPDGRHLVHVGFEGSVPSLYLVELESGQRRKLVDATARWMPRPRFSADGSQVYYTTSGQLHRIALGTNEAGEPHEPEKVSDLGGHVADATLSPDGRWLAFRRNEEIWIAALDAPTPAAPVTDAAARLLSSDGGLNFSFAPDSSAVIYAAGSRVWRQPLDGGERSEIALRLEQPAAAPVAVLVRGVRVLDFAAGGFTAATSMLVEDGRIRWIGDETGRSLPGGVRVLEAGGRYAIPGLFDSHTHVATPIHFNPARDVSRMAANVAFGVTSVRDMGSDISLVDAWSDRRERFGAPVPRIFSYGAMTEVTGPFFHGGSFFVGSEDEARALVRKEKRDGAFGIKSYFTLPWPLQRAVADEARRQGLPVAAHGLTFREVVMDAVLGRASIEHQPSPIRLYSDALQLLAETGTRWCPTIAPIGGNGILFAQQPHLLSGPRLRAFTSHGDYAMAEEVELFSILDPQVIGQAYGELLASVRQGHSMGVELLAGTDALNPNVFYGHGLHTELWHFARAGLAPIDVLRMATADAAEAVGAQQHLGTLEPGKLADVVLLEENPLEDVRNAMTVWRVLLGGRVFASTPELVEQPP